MKTLEQVVDEAIEKFESDMEAANWIQENYPDIFKENQRAMALTGLEAMTESRLALR